MSANTGADLQGGGSSTAPEPPDVARVRRLGAQLWEHALATQPYTALRAGRSVDRLRAESLEDAHEDAAFAAQLRDALLRIDAAMLPTSERLTHDFLLHACGRLQHAAEYWWTAFPYTPYNAYTIGLYGQLVFPAHGFERPADVDAYLERVSEFANWIREQTRRLDAQASRGWRIPQPALPGARATLAGLARAVAGWLTVADERLVRLPAAARARLASGVASRIDAEVAPALAAATASLGADYERLAPAAVGLAQYPGGLDAYARWTELHMTYALAPDAVHARGVAEVARLTEEMSALRARIGFRGDEAAFAEQLRAGGRLHAASAADVEARYRRCIDRIAPIVPAWFRVTPRATYDVKRLEPSAEAGMSYGYYDAPTTAQPTGLYRYNGSGLDQRLQLTAAALIYHELVPGHHFHLARQAENTSLPDIRRHCSDISVFNEGWAEYASGLAGEMGLYDDPVDAYGRLVHERFTAQRLVVDTGLNALGWSLDDARAYMGRYTLEPPSQIATETLRYSTDLPGQALAYRIGYLKFTELRERMRATVGPAFDVRDFHEAVLGEGALPLPVLESHVERVSATLAGRA